MGLDLISLDQLLGILLIAKRRAMDVLNDQSEPTDRQMTSRTFQIVSRADDFMPVGLVPLIRVGLVEAGQRRRSN